MNNKKYVLITFVVKKKTGVISFLMLNGVKLGLLYLKKFERQIDKSTSQILVYYVGNANTSDEDITESFMKRSEVLQIENIEIVDRDDMRLTPRPNPMAM